MHEHQRYIDLISAVLDGEAAPAEAAELMDHLSACPACQAAYEQTLALRDAFLGWEEPEPPGDLAAAVMSRVRQEPRRAPRRRSVPLYLRRFAAAAACLALILLGARLLPLQPAPSPEEGVALASDGVSAEAHDVEPEDGSTPAPRSLEPETGSAPSEEQMLDGVLTYFNSVPVQKSVAAYGDTEEADSSAAAAPAVTTLTSSDPELLRWMSANAAGLGYSAGELPESGEATVWLVTRSEYEALTAHLADANVEAAVEYAAPEGPAPQDGESQEALYCVVYLQAEE